MPFWTVLNIYFVFSCCYEDWPLAMKYMVQTAVVLNSHSILESYKFIVIMLRSMLCGFETFGSMENIINMGIQIKA